MYERTQTYSHIIILVTVCMLDIKIITVKAEKNQNKTVTLKASLGQRVNSKWWDWHQTTESKLCWCAQQIFESHEQSFRSATLDSKIQVIYRNKPDNNMAACQRRLKLTLLVLVFFIGESSTKMWRLCSFPRYPTISCWRLMSSGELSLMLPKAHWLSGSYGSQRMDLWLEWML